jgi:hypothetical protein
MAKKFRKALLFTAAVGSAAAAAIYWLQKKDIINPIPEDEDYDDFSEDLDEKTPSSRSYVPLKNREQKEAEAAGTAKEDAAASVKEGAAESAKEDTAASAKESAAESAKENAVSSGSEAEKEDSFTPLHKVVKTVSASAERTEETVEEFFDEEDSSDEEPPIRDTDDADE